jgi:hypothetical protein
LWRLLARPIGIRQTAPNGERLRWRDSRLAGYDADHFDQPIPWAKIVE